MATTIIPETTKPSLTKDAGLVITRVFNAPRELVFGAWREAGKLKRWWAPKGFTTPFLTVDFRLNGVFHYCMRSAEGRDYWGRSVYCSIMEPELIAYTDSFSDEKGALAEPDRYGMSPGFPSETLVTVVFTELEGKTEITLRHDVPESVPERAAMEQGWTEMLDRLDEELTNEMEG